MGVPRLKKSHLSLLSANEEPHSVAKQQNRWCKYNDLPHHVLPGSVTSASAPNSRKKKSHTSLKGKFQAPHEGDYWYFSCKSTADWLLYARMSWGTEERKREGVTVCKSPLLPLLTLSHSCSLPPSLLPPSFYNSTPLNYKPTASRNACSLPCLLCNCPSTPIWEASCLH